MRSASILFTILCLIATMAAIGHAFDVDESLPGAGFMLSSPTNVSKDLRFTADVSYIAESDFTNGLGSVEVVRNSVALDYSIFNLAYGLSYFDWAGNQKLTRSLDGSTPWDHLHDVTLQARLLNNKLGDDWKYWLNGEVSSSFEEDWPGAVGAGLSGGTAYDFWEGWMVGVTVKTVALSALNSDLFAEAEVGLALVTSQKTLRKALKSLGLFEGKKDGSDSIGFSVALSSSEKTYRLSSRNTYQQNGYLGLVRAKVGAYLEYSPNENVMFTVGPEYHYNRKYRLHDSDGSLNSSYRLANSLGGYFRVLAEF